MLLAGQCVSRYMADRAEAEKELKKDDDCEAVQLLKRQLAELGFYSGETTGTTFTDALEAAVKLFQTANGLTATGIADADTRRMINAGDCVDMSAYTDAMSACALRQGDKGYAVQLLQARPEGAGVLRRQGERRVRQGDGHGGHVFPARARAGGDRRGGRGDARADECLRRAVLRGGAQPLF